MKVALLAGGTGGAKLADGFAQVLAPGDLSVIVNVADDTELHRLHVSPDIDSIVYTLAGILNAETGWGVAGDTRTALGMLERLGAERTWFQLGDADLATHVRRTQLLHGGASLTDATAAMASALGVTSHILPATDDRVRTMIRTDAGELDFQDYFVGHRQQPDVRGVRFDGLGAARPSVAALAAVAGADLVVIGPSNPVVSIGPILALEDLRAAVAQAGAVAVSPIVDGRALKGPADRMLASLGEEVTAVGVARRYVGVARSFVLDEADAALGPQITALGMEARVLATVMRTNADRVALANALCVASGILPSVTESVRIIVPHRGLAAAKTRLAPVLAPGERVRLARELLERVLRVAREAVDDVVVITPSAELATVVEPTGATLVVQHGMGLNAGLDQARTAAIADGIELLGILHGDLPNLRADDVRALLAAPAVPRGVAIAPDRAGRGTNGLALRPPDAIQFAFGPGSFDAHASAAGSSAVVVARPGLAFDLDTPSDLARWLELGDAA